MDQQNADPLANAGETGQPAEDRYQFTAGPGARIKRPGALQGSTSGGQGDPGRNGVAALGVDLQAIAPHTGL